MTGEQTVIADVDQLEQLAGDPATRQRMESAISEIANRLGLKPEQKHQVMDKIDLFARELAFIEALRERCGLIKQIYGKLNKLASIYRQDHSVTEDLVRIMQLLRAPMSDYESTFRLVDAQTSEIMNILKKYQAQVNFIRETRDDLHNRFREWDDLIVKWEELEVVRSPEAEALIKETYRFAAYHFPQNQSWRR
jgi:uncharacterized coiled-coil DUF342 family protein